ncbi:MAG: RDD family protein [Salinisphaera sp.]|nr:RDD family protein [Salinisphaera sp.]
MKRQPALVYAGFWIRVWASIIDSALVLIVLFPVLRWIFGPGSSQTDAGQLYTASGQINWAALSISWPGPMDFILYWLLPAAIVVLFWRTRKATPGKMAIHARIVDARTGETPSSRQLIIRYLGYYVSTLPLCLGLIWVGIDARKQGWHDKLAQTVVVRPRAIADATARFEQPGADSNRDASNPRSTGWNHE